MSKVRDEYYKYKAVVGYGKFVEDYITELENSIAELTASLSISLDNKRRKLYLKELNETLDKYIKRNKDERIL